MKNPNQHNRVSTEPLDATGQERNRLGAQKHPFGVILIATVIGLTLTGTYYSPGSPNHNAASASFLTYSLPSEANSVVISSLAVMPFQNINADPGVDYISDGMSEILIGNLSQLSTLRVKAQVSVFHYKGKDFRPHRIGTALHVQAVLIGHIALVGDALELSLELADGQTDDVIWSQQYHRKQTELADLQREIARDVSKGLRLRLSGTDEQRLSKKYTTDPEAYECYLKGRFHWNKRTLEDLESAVDSFDQAISLDPNFGLAYAGRADASLILPLYRNRQIQDPLRAAREDALKALSLDDDLAEPHVTLGDVFAHDYDFAAAEREYQGAISLNPNYANAHQWYGILLFHLGRHEEACAEFRKASEIDPLSPIINLDYAEALLYTRRYDNAIDQLKKTLELNTDLAATYQHFARFYQSNGNYIKAAQSYSKYRELNDDRPSAGLPGEMLANGSMRRLLALTAKGQVDELSSNDAVVLLTALGEKHGALVELNKFYEVVRRT